MVAGRKSAWTVYNEDIFKRFSRICFEQNTDMSHIIWQLIQDYIKNYDEKTVNLDGFTTQITPKITDDFEKIIIPYLKNLSIEELKIIRDNCFMGNILSRYCIQIPLEKRLRVQTISYDKAYIELEAYERGKII